MTTNPPGTPPEYVYMLFGKLNTKHEPPPEPPRNDYMVIFDE